MKKIPLIVLLILVTACDAPQEIVQSTKTSVPLTATPAPTKTPLPSPTPTPTPEPYMLEDGVLQDWDEEVGDYLVVAEGIDDIATTADGVIVALYAEGFPRFVFENGDWVQVIIPEGAENHEELVIPDRHVSVVNEQGKVEEVLESGVKVLVNPETGVYEYEFINGQWEKYKPRVMIVGEVAVVSVTEVPREVVETAVETVKNAEMFTRDGEELMTGYAESLGEYKEKNGYTYISWYGVLCGANLSEVTFSNVPMGAAFMGVELNSGDVMLATVLFIRDKVDWSYYSVMFDGGVVPSSRDSFSRVSSDKINRTEFYEAISNAPVGTPFYVSTKISPLSEHYQKQSNDVIKAMKTGELVNSKGGLTLANGELGATDEFWKNVIDTDN